MSYQSFKQYVLYYIVNHIAELFFDLRIWCCNSNSLIHTIKFISYLFIDALLLLLFGDNNYLAATIPFGLPSKG